MSSLSVHMAKASRKLVCFLFQKLTQLPKQRYEGSGCDVRGSGCGMRGAAGEMSTSATYILQPAPCAPNPTIY